MLRGAVSQVRQFAHQPKGFGSVGYRFIVIRRQRNCVLEERACIAGARACKAPSSPPSAASRKKSKEVSGFLYTLRPS